VNVLNFDGVLFICCLDCAFGVKCKNSLLFVLSRSVVSDFVTLWTVAHQAPLSMGFFSGENTGVGCRGSSLQTAPPFGSHFS